MLALVARCLQLGLNRRRDPDYTSALTLSRGARSIDDAGERNGVSGLELDTAQERRVAMGTRAIASD
jgi:hypothetical protein